MRENLTVSFEYDKTEYLLGIETSCSEEKEYEERRNFYHQINISDGKKFHGMQSMLGDSVDSSLDFMGVSRTVDSSFFEFFVFCVVCSGTYFRSSLKHSYEDDYDSENDEFDLTYLGILKSFTNFSAQKKN